MSKLIKAHYTCRMGAKVPVGTVGQVSATEAERRGLRKVQRTVRIRRRDELVWVWVEPACDGLETTDPEVYAAHMKEHHPERFRYAKGANSDLVARASGKWRGPAAKPEGTPLNASTKEIERSLKTCPTCGLVAEINDIDTLANRLWWGEHLSMCVGTEEGAA